MDKNHFFSSNQIQGFLNDFRRNLIDLPASIKEQHVLEIKSDLYENAVKKSNTGVPENEIPQHVLREFLPPQKLANEILIEYTDQDTKEAKRSLNFMKYYTVLSIGSLGALAVPIVLGFINISSNLPFAIAFVISNLWLMFGKLPWNPTSIDFLRKVMKISKFLLVIAFGFFAIRLIMTKEFENFSLYYFISYLLIVFLYIVSLRGIYKKKQA